MSSPLRRLCRALLLFSWAGGLAVTGCGPAAGDTSPDQPASEVPSGEGPEEQGPDGGVQEPPAKPARLCVAAVQASTDDGNGPLNALDGDLSTRWSAEGEGVWLRYDFGAPSLIAAVDLAWHQGDDAVRLVRRLSGPARFSQTTYARFDSFKVASTVAGVD